MNKMVWQGKNEDEAEVLDRINRISRMGLATEGGGPRPEDSGQNVAARSEIVALPFQFKNERVRARAVAVWQRGVLGFGEA
jgi:hypothetical protein